MKAVESPLTKPKALATLDPSGFGPLALAGAS